MQRGDKRRGARYRMDVVSQKNESKMSDVMLRRVDIFPFHNWEGLFYK